MSELTTLEIAEIVKENSPYRLMEVREARTDLGDDPGYVYVIMIGPAPRLTHLRYPFAINKDRMNLAPDPKEVVLECLNIANADLEEIDRSGDTPANLILWS